MPAAPKITQETFDETLIENEDLFDLAPDAAIEETLHQFEQQGISRQDLQSYILTSHPDSDVGREERATRKKFEGYLQTLDDAILSSGDVHADVLRGNENGNGTRRSGVEEALDGVWNFCNHGSDDDSDVAKKSKDRYAKSMGFLTLIHSTNSIFTLMSLLGVVPLPASASSSASASESESVVPDTNTDTDQMELLQRVVRLLTAILTPRRPSERDIKSRIKDQFVAMERLLLLMSHFITCIQLFQSQTNSDADANTVVNDSDAAAAAAAKERNVEMMMETLRAIVALSTAATRGSERNKVAFVRAFKIASAKRSPNDKMSTIALLVKGLTVSYNLASASASSLSLPSSSSSSSANTTTTNSKPLLLMTEFCKLITILCRFDDFRSDNPSTASSGGGLGVDSSYGMNVSSSHDHVLEFNREGVVPVLYDVTIMALTTKTNNTQQEEDHATTTTTATSAKSIVDEDEIVSLASAAMSATRVLAVNDEIVQALVAVGILKVVKLALEMGVKDASHEGNDIAIASEQVEEDASPAAAAAAAATDANTEAPTEDQPKSQNNRIKIHRQNLTSGAIGLIRNLCGNDSIKTSLCLGAPPSDPSTSSLPSILQGMRLYRDNATIQEHGCGSLAAMALRKPMNAMRIVQENGPREIIAALGKFPNHVLVQRQGALAVRNIVSRLVVKNSDVDDDDDEMEGQENHAAKANDATTDMTEEDSAASAGATGAATDAATSAGDSSSSINVRDVFLDLGAEVVLRHITGRHQGSVDEAYAALRDLGCEVTMTKFDEKTQTFTRKVEMFGEVKSNFRPVYDDGDDKLQDKIDACGIR